MLGLAVTVLMRDIGGPYGDADREEGQEGGDQVGAGVRGRGDEPKAV